jgi:hypothetical protein
MAHTLKIFQSLEGTWIIYRTLSRYGKEMGVIKGFASFNKKDKLDNTLLYRENGQWYMPEQEEPLEVSREYKYVYDEISDAVTVYFIEGKEADRLFYKLEFENSVEDKTPKAAGKHKCGNDLYQAKYQFERNESAFKDDDVLIYSSISLTYIVDGPSKQDVIETKFIKQDGSKSK